MTVSYNSVVEYIIISDHTVKLLSGNELHKIIVSPSFARPMQSRQTVINENLMTFRKENFLAYFLYAGEVALRRYTVSKIFPIKLKNIKF